MRERRGGFTTFELIIVMLVAAVLAASVVPTLRFLSGMQADTGVATVVRDLRYAQTLAMTERLETWVAFQVATESYSLYIESAPNVGRAGRVPVKDPLLQDDFTRDLGALFGGHCNLATVNIKGTSEVMFDAAGVPHNASDAALTSTGSVVFDDGRSITIYDQTGYVEFAP
ncbi:MAG: Tfp pilus assembly protein FimT/FimU [Planctomycetota bacterium]